MRNIGHWRYSASTPDSGFVFFMSCQEWPRLCISASAFLPNLFLSLPLFLFPRGLRIRACLVMFLGGFLMVWPMQPYFLLRICEDSGSWFAFLHRSSLILLSGQRIQKTVWRQLLMKVWSVWSFALVILNILDPYRSNVVTFMLSTFSLLDFPISPKLQTFLTTRKAVCALPILALMSSSVPPCVSTMSLN